MNRNFLSLKHTCGNFEKNSNLELRKTFFYVLDDLDHRGTPEPLFETFK